MAHGRRCSRRNALALVACALAPAAAWAGPLDDPHVGGLGFSGPTSGDVAAVHWNPAALSLAGRSQITIAGTARLQGFEAELAGAPTATGRGDIHPFTRPAGPGLFIGGAADVAGRFTIALAGYTPFRERAVYDTVSGLEPLPTRYHRVAVDMRNFALVPALAFRIGTRLRLGVSPGFLFSEGRITWDEQTTAADGTADAARYDIGSSLYPFASSPAFTLGGGLHLKLGDFGLGLAYSSRPLGTEEGGVDFDAPESSITRAGQSICPVGFPDRCVSGHIQYRLPDTFIAGLSWQASPRLELLVVARYLNYSQHQSIVMRVNGPAPGLEAAGLPGRIVLYRGFQDTLELRFRAAYDLRPWLRVGGGLRFETAAVPREATSPAAIGGAAFEPSLLAEVRLGRVVIAAGWALLFMPEVTVTSSRFDPTAAKACADANGDLGVPACRTRLEGAARPSAAGRYRTNAQTFGLSTTVRF